MKSTTLKSYIADAERLRFSEPLKAYALVNKAARKALLTKDLSSLALANEIRASLARVTGDMATAQASAESALMYFRAMKNIGKEASCLLLIGQNFYETGNIRKALNLYMDAERLVKHSNGNKDVLVRALGLQANTKLTLGKPADALKSFIKSLHICEQYNLELEAAIVYQGLASLYFLEEDYDKALMYSYRALPIFKATNDNYRQCFNLNSLGIIFIRKHEIAKALECFSKAVKIANRLGMVYMIIWSQSNLIELHIKENNVARASRLIKKLILLTDKKLDVISHATILATAGNFYLSLKKTDLAIKNLRSAIDLFASSQYGKLQVLEKLLEVYIQIDDVDNAIKTFTEYLSLKDELFSKENQHEITLLEADTEAHRKSSIKDEKLEKYSQFRLEKNDLLLSLKQRFSKSRYAKSAIEALDNQVQRIEDAFDHELYISLMYSDFLARLSKRYPDLSSTELKIATLLRLNMPSKRIGSLLSISIRTVEYHRMNIRKKLRLKTKDKIQLFLIKI